MGQKTHPVGFRLGSTRTWSSRWFATKQYASLLHEDVKIRRYIKDQLYHAGIARIDIERSVNRARITIATARPGIIIGRKGAEVERLKNELQQRTAKEIYLNIEEVIHPELDAQLVAENVALQLPKRVKYRKTQRGRMRGKAQRGSTLSFGDFGLKALEPGWVTNRQIEAARVALTRSLKRGGKVCIRVFPDKPVTKKPAETRMGKGKGNPEEWVAVVKPGRILYEMEGVPEDVAREAFRTAANKIGITTKFVTRTRSL